MGVALPPESDALYGGKLIPPDYARVDVTWTNTEFDDDEINIPTEEGSRFISATLGMCVLWNKGDIVLEVPMPAVARSQSPPPSDPGDDDDDDNTDDDNGGDNDNASGPGSSPQGSPAPGNSSPQGGTRAAPGDVTPPPASGLNEGISQCPSPPRKPTDEEEAIPPNHTKLSWVAYQIATSTHT
jgi:hypothetical protein